jgi:hypothetical protein
MTNTLEINELTVDELKEAIKEFIEQNREVIDLQSYDCSELAEDIENFLFSKYQIHGDIITFEPEDKLYMLKVREKNSIKEYEYHTVYLVNGLIIDVRNITNVDNIQLKTFFEYLQDLETLNFDIKIINSFI